MEELPPTPPPQGQALTVKLTNLGLDQLIIVCSAQFVVVSISMYLNLCLFEFILSASLLLLVTVNKVIKEGVKIVYLNNVIGII